MIGSCIRGILYLSGLIVIVFHGNLIANAVVQSSIVEMNRNNTIQGEGNNVDVKIESIPRVIENGQEAKYLVSLFNKESNILQRHVDFDFAILKNNSEIFSAAKQANLPLLHSARGGEVIPYSIEQLGNYTIRISVSGVNFILYY
jgi:hypothetical protein